MIHILCTPTILVLWYTFASTLSYRRCIVRVAGFFLRPSNSSIEFAASVCLYSWASVGGGVSFWRHNMFLCVRLICVWNILYGCFDFTCYSEQFWCVVSTIVVIYRCHYRCVLATPFYLYTHIIAHVWVSYLLRKEVYVLCMQRALQLACYCRVYQHIHLYYYLKIIIKYYAIA